MIKFIRSEVMRGFKEDYPSFLVIAKRIADELYTELQPQPQEWCICPSLHHHKTHNPCCWCGKPIRPEYYEKLEGEVDNALSHLEPYEQSQPKKIERLECVPFDKNTLHTICGKINEQTDAINKLNGAE